MASCAVPTFDAALLPSGSHPSLRLTLPAKLAPSSCALYLHLAVPSSVILDRYQLSQLHEEGRLGAPISAASGSSSAGPGGVTSFAAVGEADLELPESRTGPADLLVRLREGRKGKEKAPAVGDEPSSFDVPLHARYLEPRAERYDAGGERVDSSRVEVEWPRVFYHCSPDQASPPLMGCPPSTLPSDLSAHFGERDRLYFLAPSPGNLPVKRSPLCPPPAPRDTPLTITLPTGVAADLPYVELGTVLAVWAGALWVAVRGGPVAPWLGRRAKTVKAE